ncbi:MAG: hypothetical protein LBC19_01775 [Tannerella sp.]|jgi:hypothetical protein|nr:hypothetical protein [Tannerella sp.]
MNQFTAELKNILEQTKIQSLSFAGRDCYSKVTDNVSAKICFCATDCADNYDAVKVTLINRNEGIVDSNIIRFRDILGKKSVNHPNFRDGVYPHLWENNGTLKWYVYQPTKADFQAIADEVSECVNMFGQEIRQGLGEEIEFGGMTMS